VNPPEKSGGSSLCPRKNLIRGRREKDLHDSFSQAWYSGPKRRKNTPTRGREMNALGGGRGDRNINAKRFSRGRGDDLHPGKKEK